MSNLHRHASVSDAGVALFKSAGIEIAVAQCAVEALVMSSLMGHDSHGVMRIPEYLGFVQDGSINKRADVTVVKTSPTTAIVDCDAGFGAVGAERAIHEAIAIAREQRTATVITKRCNHVGRLGAWVQTAAEDGMLAIATCNSPIHGHFVLPFGGREGRLATNPIAYAAPTSGDPIVADFSTSVAPEGKVRFFRNNEQPLPDGWILDHAGKPSNDANDFYGPPRGGILPLGGSAGHKGYALSLLVEILGSALAGVSSTETDSFGNGVCFVVIDPSAFCPLATFRQLMDEMVGYIKSTTPAPGFEEVLVPGELEFRTKRQREKTGIPIDRRTLEAMEDYGRDLQVDVESLLELA